MVRTVRHWLVGLAVAGGGVAAAQQPFSPAALAGGAPSPAPAKPVETPARAQAPAPADAEVLVMRTAGQPDRKIRVLKVSQYADGVSMADVQDVESGQKFTVPAKIVAALKKSATSGAGSPQAPVSQPLPAALPIPTLPPQNPKPVPVAPPPVQQPAQQPAQQTVQQTVQQASAVQPVAIPKSGIQPAAAKLDPQPVKPPPAVIAPVVKPAPAAPVTTTPTPSSPTGASAWRTLGEPQPNTAPKPAAPQPAPVPAPAAAPKRDLWNAVGTPATSTVTPQPTAPPTPAGPQLVPSATTPGFAPTLPPAETVTRGQAPEPNYGYRRLQFRPANWEQPARGFPTRPTDVPVRPADGPRVREEREPLGQVGYAFPARRPSLEQQLMDDTKQHVFDLYTAVRPTVREGAASALAEGRFGSRPEVKQVLAKAALADPAASVRAHCIRLLNELGYHDPEYVTYLQECSATGHEVVQTAATVALANLAPRR